MDNKVDLDLMRRENALIEGLDKNEAETSRWETYREENKQASENMDMFIKKLNIEVLVPIGGNKAFMPGSLYHTNEILIGHYNGMFSTCTTAKAQEIVKYRLKLAKERLECLKKERDMFQNKLNVPHVDGVLANENQQEIIEEYDEEKENIWREEHKKRMREYKQKEKMKESKEIENDEKTHEDIMEMLNNLELVDELDQELEDLEVDDGEMLQKLMSGEIKLPPEKRRISHANSNSNIVVGLSDTNNKDDDNENSKSKIAQSNFDSSMEEVYQKYKSNKSLETQLENDYTNNNSIPNSEDFMQQVINEDYDSNDYSDDDDDEFEDIEKQIVNMSTKEKIQYCKAEAKKTEEFLRSIRIKNEDDYNTKIRFLEILDYLYDKIELLKDERDNDNEKEKNSKRKVSFALEDEVKFIEGNNQKVDMMNLNKHDKDIIVLDPDVYPIGKVNSKDRKEVQITNVIDKKASILDKVEKNRSSVLENQSKENSDLIDSILSLSLEQEKNLVKEFYHQNYKNRLQNASKDNEIEKEIKFSQNEIIKEAEQKKNDVIDDQTKKIPVKISIEKKENDDKKIEIEDHKTSVPNIETNDKQEKCQQSITKSILKNKDAVKLETHKTVEKVKNTKCRPTKSSQEEKLSCYEKVIGEIVENPSKEPITPDPLPEGNFIDAHQPKKRISRFKQMRDKNSK